MKKRQDPTDGFLITQYRSGRTEVLPTLVKRYHKTFCEKAYWITKDKEKAKDIAQDCWIIIIDKLYTLDNVNSFKGWASRIVYTKAIDSIKHRHKYKETIEDARLMSNELERSEDDNASVRVELLKAIHKAIQQLPKGKQDIIRLFYAEEYSINDISSFLNIPIGTVKSRLFKARQKLKSIMQKVNYEK